MVEVPTENKSKIDKFVLSYFVPPQVYAEYAIGNFKEQKALESFIEEEEIYEQTEKSQRNMERERPMRSARLTQN